MHKKSYLILLILIFGFNSILSGNLVKIQKHKLNKLEKAYVIKVYDGDTFKISTGEKIRLLGVDTPEIDHSNSKKNEYYAKKAFKFTERTILNKNIFLEYDNIKKEDKYGRRLCYVYFKNGVMLNSLLLKKGYADLYFIPPNNKYNKKFHKILFHAIDSNKGKWDKLNKKYWDNKKIIKSNQAEKYCNKHVIVKGVIYNTHDNGNEVFLDFTKNYKKGFTAIIFKPEKYNYHIPPEKLFEEKKVKISGKIQKYKENYQIKIKNRNQIKILEEVIK